MCLCVCVCKAITQCNTKFIVYSIFFNTKPKVVLHSVSRTCGVGVASSIGGNLLLSFNYCSLPLFASLCLSAHDSIYVLFLLHISKLYFYLIFFCSGVASLQTFRLAARTSGGQVLFDSRATTAGQANLRQV